MLHAKSVKDNISLIRHSLETEEAASALFKGRFFQNWCNFFQLKDPERYLLHVRVAAVFHDLGKANSGFQNAVKTNSIRYQPYRHEHLSAMILHLPEMRKWLGTAPGLDVDVVLAAVLGHHLKVTDDPSDGKYRWMILRMGQTQPPKIYLGNAEVQGIFRRVQEIAGVGDPPSLSLSEWGWKEGQMWEASAFQAAFAFARRKRGFTDKTFTAAVKAGVILADTVASAQTASGKISEWIEEVIHRDPADPSVIHTEILAHRPSSDPGKTSFQDEVARLGDRAMVLAGTGSGKTQAAYRWASEVLGRHPRKHVVFLYPTRATAAEGFRGYLHAPWAESALLSSSARYDLLGMADGEPHEEDEQQDRLRGLGLWGKSFFSSTVDQFLGFLTNTRTGIVLLPVLVDAALIFDEVHAYDDLLFGHLLAFLEHFRVPVLCLSASLPEARRKALERLGVEVFQDTPDIQHRQRKRHLVSPVNQNDAFVAASKAHGRGEKVLWVVNTVARCQEIAREVGIEPWFLPYHARFRLMDRVARHRAVMDLFEKDGPCVAVTTQVCEMSLDLDADLLITEVAPIPSLIQRFGRSARLGSQRTSEILWYDPQKDGRSLRLPYEEKEMKRGEDFLKRLSGSSWVSQEDLAALMSALEPGRGVIVDDPKFIKDGYFVSKGDLRDIRNQAEVVLDSDVEEVLRLRGEGKPIDGYVLAIPKGSALQVDPRLPRYLKVAPASNYTTEFGYDA